MKHADENIYIFPTFSDQLAASVWFPFNFKGPGVFVGTKGEVQP